MSVIIALILATAARPAASFDDEKNKAVELDRLSNAVRALVGLCDQQDPEMQFACQENVKKQRAELKGKRFYIDLGAGHQQLLEFEGLRGKKARFLWVPMYDPGEGMPITVGRPSKLTSEGWPILKKKVLDGTVPADVMSGDLKRLAVLGQVNIELVGSFGPGWQINRRGNPVRGVVFKLDAIRLSQARTGETVLEIVY